MKEVKRGEIYYFTLGNLEEIGSEQKAGRPGIIVSNEMNNKHSDCLEVVMLTTKQKKSLPTHVDIDSSTYPSIALCEQIKTYSKLRMGDYLGMVTATELAEIDNALAISLSLPPAGADRSFEVDAMENKIEALETQINYFEKQIDDFEKKSECDSRMMNDYICEIETLSLDNLNLKIENDVYKRMYEQLLERVIPADK